MALINGYPVKTTPVSTDHVTGSDSQDNDSTKQFEIGTLLNGSPVDYTQELDGNDLLLKNNGTTKSTTDLSELYNRDNDTQLGYKVIPENFDFENIPADYDNSIWEIRYTHDLDSASITIPENVILKFEGGKITNYIKVIGNKTKIQAGLTPIFDSSGVLEGSWDVSEVFVEWFGAKGDLTDETLLIQKALDFSEGRIFTTTFNVYLISRLVIPSDVVINNINSVFRSIPNNTEGSVFTTGTSMKNNIVFKNIIIFGDRENQVNTVSAIGIGDSSYNIIVEGGHLYDLSGFGVGINGHDILIEGVLIENTNKNSINASNTLAHPIYNIDVKNNIINLDSQGVDAGCIEFDDGAENINIIYNICTGTLDNEHLIQVEQLSKNFKVIGNKTFGGRYGIYIGDSTLSSEVNGAVTLNETTGALITGIFIQKCERLTVNNNVSYSNGNDGIRIVEGKYLNVHSNTSKNNGKTTNNRYGILSSGNTFCNLYGNITYDTQNTKTQAYGIGVSSGNNNSFTNNISNDNLISNWQQNESDSSFINNIGYDRIYLPNGSQNIHSEIRLQNRLVEDVRTMTNVGNPSILNGNHFATGGTTTIFTFADGRAGQRFTVIAKHEVTITSGSSMILQGNSDYTMKIGESITFVKGVDNNYYEISRSTNRSGSSSGTILNLSKPQGVYYNMASANSASIYSIANIIDGGWAKVRINSSVEPTVIGAVKEVGAEFIANKDMYLNVYYNTYNTRFYFSYYDDTPEVLTLNGYTVATLPTGILTGAVAYVTDSLDPTALAIVVGGGAAVVRVFYNGVNWIVG